MSHGARSGVVCVMMHSFRMLDGDDGRDVVDVSHDGDGACLQ